MNTQVKQRTNSALASSFVGLFVGLVIGALILPGCTSPQRVEDQGAVHVQVIEADQYEQAFGVVREVLSDYRFGINRVDISRGIITTHPKRTSGLASLWDQEQSTLGQELEDLANQHEREIRVVFANALDSDGAESNAALGEGDVPIELRVEVVVYRIHRPHWRIEPESIRYSTHARSRDSAGHLDSPSFREAIGQDKKLAERVLRAVEDQLSSND